MMLFDRKSLKRQAREAMRLTRPRFWAVCLIYLLLTTGVEGLIYQLSSFRGSVWAEFSFFLFFCTILYNLYYVVIYFGYNLWSLWTWRRLNPGAGALIQGFSIAGRVIIMEMLIILRMFLWVFLLAMGMTILFFLIPVPAAYVLGILLFYIAVVSSGVLLFFLIQNGAFSTAISADNLWFYQSVINSAPAFLLSNLIVLPLSLWVIPYTSVAQAGFYDTLCRQNQSYEQMPPL